MQAALALSRRLLIANARDQRSVIGDRLPLQYLALCFPKQDRGFCGWRGYFSDEAELEESSVRLCRAVVIRG